MFDFDVVTGPTQPPRPVTDDPDESTAGDRGADTSAPAAGPTGAAPAP
ncbi:hypothetical protein [Azospirillum halopraeferens]|nr:hypothetical protein [Azospirillum halopraeferens]